VIGKGVFVGPGVIFTNDRFPRAVNVDQLPKKPDEWEKVGVTVNDYASIGAGAICVAPVSIGNWSMIGAGSVLTRDVPNYALFMGNPARFVCWVGRAGRPLIEVETKRFACSITNQLYELKDSNELELL
jgi:acetyltransferase-like isoleucine patch superfamily enzyme